MAAEAVSYPGHSDIRSNEGQLGLYAPRGAQRWRAAKARRALAAASSVANLCAGCRAKEARYGVRDDSGEERPRTLCFECFRMELDFRHRVAAQLARGWNAQQAPLPLAVTLNELSLRRRRAQIKANRFVSS